jgi:hypothetical protein
MIPSEIHTVELPKEYNLIEELKQGYLTKLSSATLFSLPTQTEGRCTMIRMGISTEVLI